MSIDSITESIQLEIGMVPKSLIKKTALKVAREFSSETNVLKASLSVTVAAGEHTVSLPNPSADLLTLRVFDIAELQPRQYSQTEFNELYLNQTPINDLDLNITVVCRTSPSATDLPSELNLWDRAIEAGVLYELYKTPKKEWTDLNMAAVKKAEFDGYTHSAKQLSAMNHQAGGRKLRFRKFI
jgi:hypothetical protein